MLLGNKGNVSESLGLLVVLSIFFPLNQLQKLRGFNGLECQTYAVDVSFSCGRSDPSECLKVGVYICIAHNKILFKFNLVNCYSFPSLKY